MHEAFGHECYPHSDQLRLHFKAQAVKACRCSTGIATECKSLRQSANREVDVADCNEKDGGQRSIGQWQNASFPGDIWCEWTGEESGLARLCSADTSAQFPQPGAITDSPADEGCRSVHAFMRHVRHDGHEFHQSHDMYGISFPSSPTPIHLTFLEQLMQEPARPIDHSKSIGQVPVEIQCESDSVP